MPWREIGILLQIIFDSSVMFVELATGIKPQHLLPVDPISQGP